MNINLEFHKLADKEPELNRCILFMYKNDEGYYSGSMTFYRNTDIINRNNKHKLWWAYFEPDNKDFIMAKAEIVKFADIKDKVIEIINLKEKFLNINEPVTLVEGFVKHSVSMELSGSITIGGPTIPMIMLLGSETGQIYFFAYKGLIKDKAIN